MMAPRTAAGADKAKPPPALGKAARKRTRNSSVTFPPPLARTTSNDASSAAPSPVIQATRLTKKTDSAAMDTLAASGLMKIRINGPMATVGTQ